VRRTSNALGGRCKKDAGQSNEVLRRTVVSWALPTLVCRTSAFDSLPLLPALLAVCPRFGLRGADTDSGESIPLLLAGKT